MGLPSVGARADRPGRGPAGPGHRRPSGTWAVALFAAGVAVLLAVPLILIIATHSSSAEVAGGGRVAGEQQQFPAGPNGSPVAGLHPITSASAGACAASCAPSSPAVPAAAVPPALADPSGQAMPVGDLPGWHQVFADNFAVPVPLGSFPRAVSSKWGGYDGAKDTSGNGTYTPSQVVSVSGGLMNLRLHTDGGRALVAAPVPKLSGAGRGGGMVHGRYAVRFRADPVPGYKTAWLLWPDSNNWPDGEIDFPEADLTTNNIRAFMHYMGDPQSQDAYSTRVGYSGWHTAIIEWTAQAVTFTLDGKVIGQSTDTSVIPTKPLHWVLQTETSLTNNPPSASAAGNVQIDWVAAWAQA